MEQEEDELQRAIAASAHEARLATMTEEELIALAIQDSLKPGAINSIDLMFSSPASARASTSTGAVQKRRRSASPEAPSQDTRKQTPDGEARGPRSEAREPPAKRNAFAILKQGRSKSPISSSASGSGSSAVAMPVIGPSSFHSSDPRAVAKLSDGLDLVFWKGWLREPARSAVRHWMLAELSWHRVVYTRPNGGITIRTPRYTTTFGKDDGPGNADGSYSKAPKPIPQCLMLLKQEIERITNAQYNALIVNYYADGNDSISYHSDDESFLGPNPCIASLTLGSTRDFFMRRKAPSGVSLASSNQFYSKGSGPAGSRPTEKFLLEDGDLLLMRGRTQAEWEHAVPKRKNASGGRINITFRRVVNRKGTENFLRYNRGDGPPFRFRNGRMEEAPDNPGL